MNTALDSYISLDSKVQTHMHKVHKWHHFLLRVQHLAKFPSGKHTVHRMASDTIMCRLMKTARHSDGREMVSIWCHSLQGTVTSARI